MRMKDGVLWEDMHESMWHARDIAEEGCELFFNRECIITSARDGQHMHGSLHYQGKAMDIRSYDQPDAEVQAFCSWLRRRLGPDYDVVIETNPDHVHIEYDPD